MITSETSACMNSGGLKDFFKDLQTIKNKILYIQSNVTLLSISQALSQVICLIIIFNKRAEEKKTVFMK